MSNDDVLGFDIRFPYFLCAHRNDLASGEFN